MPILDPYGRPFIREPARREIREAAVRLKARYDASLTNEQTQKQWMMADGWQADALNSPGVRRLLRNRSRYETSNNSYARGIQLTLANDTIGRGPHLQLGTGSEKADARLNMAFARWSKEVKLGEKLRTGRMARFDAGEIFYLFITNNRLRSPVKLDVREIEADQVSTPDLTAYTPTAVDGIKFDEAGNPLTYDLLKWHPGALMAGVGMPFDYDRVPADQMVHYFRKERPGQRRGVPEVTPALLLFLQLRRFTQSVLTAAESAAEHSGILYTDTPPDGEAEEAEPFDTIEIVRKMLTVMPGGWKLEQMKAEHPNTTYVEFVKAILNEIARCLNMPLNVAMCNSAAYNYSSGRLDHQVYFKSIGVDRDHLEREVLWPILIAWLDEAVLVPGLIPDGLPPIDEWQINWYWDGHGHVDPEKEANAQGTRLANNTTTLESECARDGRDWRQVLRQRALELETMRELGIPLANEPGAPPAEPSEEEPATAGAAD